MHPENRHRRHPEAPRSHQRGEGSRVQPLKRNHNSATARARALTRLECAGFRDDACGGRQKSELQNHDPERQL